ncbi:MAG: hypothetical protein HZA46_00615 [Planctomycetales bacterium]|nr:hypothetical protein [Planctomycetales bacterium]
MEALLEALSQFLSGTGSLLTALAGIVLPWTPLACWIAFWMFGVNWIKLRETLSAGGWIGVLLISAVAVLIWGNIAPPDDGYHTVFGLTVTNFVGKTVYVSALVCIMFLAGSLQLSGCCANCCQFEELVQVEESHGNDQSHDHGHDDHGGSHH